MVKRRWFRVVCRILAVVILVCASGCMIRWFEQRQVYIPSREMAASAQDLRWPCEDVWFETEDGVRLNGWFYPAESNSVRRGLVILLFHGNAGNISHRLPYYRVLLQTGANVCCFDYRGYGRSTGQPSEEGTYRDGQAALRWLEGKGFPGTKVILLGKSLGGGVASELAYRQTVGGLILQNTFQSIPQVAKEMFPGPIYRLGRIRYDTHAKLPNIKVPVLIMHSRADEFIGFHQAEANFAAANEPKMFWELSGRHNETLEAQPGRYLEGLQKFFGQFFL